MPTCSFEESELKFLYRAPTQIELHNIRNKILTCIKSAAEATNCAYALTSEDNRRSAYRGMLFNETMTELFGKHAKSMGLYNFEAFYIYNCSWNTSYIKNVLRRYQEKIYKLFFMFDRKRKFFNN